VGRLGRIHIRPLRKIENCFFKFPFQGNGIQIKIFEYIQTKYVKEMRKGETHVRAHSPHLAGSAASSCRLFLLRVYI
jgi:hypothetical protein